MEHGSPSETDNYSVNEKKLPRMETNNLLPYNLLYQNTPLAPTLSKMNQVHSSANFISE
jgi:hypothetical protein